ncbi:MAG: hypothetical protein ACE5PV_11315 [Candidatus Poribacteria bacterium]
MSMMMRLPNPLPSPQEAKKILFKNVTPLSTARMLLEDILQFERKYQMSSEAFFDKYPDHTDAPDEVDWFAWDTSYAAFVRALKENRIRRYQLYGNMAD